MISIIYFASVYKILLINAHVWLNTELSCRKNSHKSGLDITIKSFISYTRTRCQAYLLYAIHFFNSWSRELRNMTNSFTTHQAAQGAFFFYFPLSALHPKLGPPPTLSSPWSPLPLIPSYCTVTCRAVREPTEPEGVKRWKIIYLHDSNRAIPFPFFISPSFLSFILVFVISLLCFRLASAERYF